MQHNVSLFWILGRGLCYSGEAVFLLLFVCDL